MQTLYDPVSSSKLLKNIMLVTYIPSAMSPSKSAGHLWAIGRLVRLQGGKPVEVTEEVLTQLREVSSFIKAEKLGAIRIASVKAKSQAAQPELRAAVEENDMTALEVIEKVALIDDIPTLQALAKQDKRKTVDAAIAKRIKVIQEETDQLLGE